MESKPSIAELKPGLYRHFKGGLYEVLGLARHSETEEVHVLYRPLYDEESGLWLRPLAMFDEWVERDGRRFRRFEFAGEAGSSPPASPGDDAQ